MDQLSPSMRLLEVLSVNATGTFVSSTLFVIMDGVSVCNCGHILVNAHIPWTPFHYAASLSFSSCYTFATGSRSLTRMLLKFFLSFLFSSSNFCWYQFNSYICINVSQVCILPQIFFQTYLPACYILIASPMSLSFSLKPGTNSLSWFSVSMRSLSQLLGLRQGQLSFLSLCHQSKEL